MNVFVQHPDGVLGDLLAEHGDLLVHDAVEGAPYGSQITTAVQEDGARYGFQEVAQYLWNIAMAT